MMQYGFPEVFESDARGIVKEVFEDIKYVLKVPMVNFIFRALANYPEFLTMAWQQVRPNMLTINMETAANKLRFPALTTVPQYDFSKDHHHQTLNHIHNIISTFQYVNPKLLLIASLLIESLADRPITTQKQIKGHIQPGIYSQMPHIDLVHIPQAPISLRTLLSDVAKTHNSFDVASDYRALANYPKFLHVTWSHLKPYISSDEYTILKSAMLNRAVNVSREEMPCSVWIDKNYLASIYSPDQIAGIMGVVSFFHQFLPGLIIENEFMRRMII
ncbi:hypothetical protein GCM10008986_13370 [Salinibacillus aidingensis]|uniref:Uncharacterized protein n=1 Tax=Salinibacillus aidingensis TaxID=237684 RepID=A0ABN1B2S4_9BACI